MPRTLTLTEAADMLKVHVDTVSDLIRHEGAADAAQAHRGDGEPLPERPQPGDAALRKFVAQHADLGGHGSQQRRGVRVPQEVAL